MTIDDDDPKLTPQEEWLVRCAEKGEWWGFKNDPADPVAADFWDESRVLRASVIRALAAGTIWPTHLAPWRLSPKGIRIFGAWIVGELDLNGACIPSALGLHCCAFDGTPNLDEARTQTVSFHGSHVPGLRAQGAKFDGAFWLREGFSSTGGVSLIGASVVDEFDCDGGHFSHEGGIALDCHALKVGASVFLRNGFTAKGEVSLVRATVGGHLDCDDGHFDNGAKAALNCDTLCVGASVFLRNGFSAKGRVDFFQAKIGGNMRCHSGAFENPKGIALDLTLADIGAGLFLSQMSQVGADHAAIEGQLLLSQARCTIYSDAPSSWPAQGHLTLDGFVYERFHDCTTECGDRRDWLMRQIAEHRDAQFRPQPWIQAIKVLRDMGHDREARNLGIEFEKARAGRSNTRWYWKLWHYFTFYTVGCGYKPEWAGVWSLSFILFGWLTFAAAANLGFMAPRDGDVIAYLAANTGADLPEHYTRFNALIFAMDAYLPVIELGQDLSWEPSLVQQGGVRPRAADEGWVTCAKRLATGQNAAWQTPVRPARPCGDAQDSGLLSWPAALLAYLFQHGFHRVVYWTDEILGWTFISLFIAGMSGLMKKE